MNQNNLLLAGGPSVEITNPVLGPELQSLTQSADRTALLGVLLPNAIGLIMLAGFVFFVFMVLIGAVQWILSGGDKAALEGARGKISSAIIGVVILLSTFALIILVETFFKINILAIDIGPLVIQ